MSFKNHLNVSFFSPSLLLAAANYFADQWGTCLLYSGGHLDSAQHSFLGLFPYETIAVNGCRIHYRLGGRHNTFEVHNPWQGLQDYFFSSLAKDPDAMAFGWLGYGMGAFADPDKPLLYRPSALPDAYWQRCAVVLSLDHLTGQAAVQINAFAAEHVDGEAKLWMQRLGTVEGWQDFSPATEFSLLQTTFADCPQRRAAYLDKVRQAQELIRDGEIYQVNLSQAFEFQCMQPPFALFRQICESNPAPFSAYFKTEHAVLVCTSPERFLFKKGLQLEARPIKGTIQRGGTVEKDAELKALLLASPKERAELLMITDLMRNDLGKISETGSVKTTDLWRCEAYTNVFHLLSIIRSTVRRELTLLEIIRACFPGGSITGCPKLRAMEVIDALEQRPRGIYTGSIGYATGSGDFDLNIAIRTLVVEKDFYTLQLGSGIVIDSNPEQEYQETLFKGASFFKLLQRSFHGS